LGACCFFSSCLLTTYDACRDQSGEWVGGSCGEQSCSLPVPVKVSTWGSIKSTYR
jgi:hypothetical protein